jgi:cysteine synthase A
MSLTSTPKIRYQTAGRGRIYDNIVETVGDTPLVRIHRAAAQARCSAHILAKLEFFNPLASVKDRLALGMIEAAETEGRLIPGVHTLVEPTSGNTGIALAFVAAAKGYAVTIVMPESMSLERRKMLLFLGATLELTPAHRGMRGAIARAEEICAGLPHHVMLQQFCNPANTAIHRQTTAEEIWRDTEGNLDVFVAGVGTGGTLTGVAQALKQRKPDLHIVAVEPTESPVLAGGQPGPHKIQGIGAGFIPEVLDRTLIDEIIPISSDTAFATARMVAKLDGIPGGISSGATLAAAFAIGQRPEMQGKRIVTIVASFAERYLSTELFTCG